MDMYYECNPSTFIAAERCKFLPQNRPYLLFQHCWRNPSLCLRIANTYLSVFGLRFVDY